MSIFKTFLIDTNKIIAINRNLLYDGYFIYINEMNVVKYNLVNSITKNIRGKDNEMNIACACFYKEFVIIGEIKGSLAIVDSKTMKITINLRV
jgi:hypothetical protein